MQRSPRPPRPRPRGARRALACALTSLSLLAPVRARGDTPEPAPAPAQAPAAATGLAYRTYLAGVARQNLELAAQRAGVSVAEAQIEVAKVFPDPTLTGGVASVDVSRTGSPTATTLGVSVPIELGGKRGARVAAARSEHEVAKSDLDELLRTIRGAATDSFIDSLYARLVLSRKRETHKSLETLVSVNEDRLRAGDIGKVALTQSRVEAQRSAGEVISAEADVSAADLGLLPYLGAARAIGEPEGDLRIKPRSFDLGALLAQAKANRPDLASKKFAVEAAAGRVDVARANRWIDVTLAVGWQHSFASSMSSTFGFQPAYDALSATVSVPIPFSKVYRGELDAALATQSQATTTAQAATLRVDVEVRQALGRYNAAVARLGLYTGGLLADADQVLESTLYNYKRGGATLLEVLEAQRTQNDVYLAYYGALADHARALVAVEQAAGIWDVDL